MRSSGIKAAALLAAAASVQHSAPIHVPSFTLTAPPHKVGANKKKKAARKAKKTARKKNR